MPSRIIFTASFGDGFDTVSVSGTTPFLRETKNHTTLAMIVR